jgi:hypothetical protein
LGDFGLITCCGDGPVRLALDEYYHSRLQCGVFLFICRRQIALAMPTSGNEDWRLTFSAVFATLLFAVHPLRGMDDGKKRPAGRVFLAPSGLLLLEGKLRPEVAAALDDRGALPPMACHYS